MSSTCIRRMLITVLVIIALNACSPETPVSEQVYWQPYDESDELATLAAHPDERMHFELLNSVLRDKNELWKDFTPRLDEFGADRYAKLKPLVLERPVRDLQSAVAEGLFSYEELTLFYLYRIRLIESDRERYLNAVIATNPAALELARDRDKQLASGVQPDPDSLFGIPVLLKDNINAAEMPTTAGAAALQSNMPNNAFITQRLLDTGAVILGKSNLSEWAYFFCEDCPSGYSAVGGQTLNPYGRFMFGTGGSSSGSGAAVAANLAAVTIGSETSGSILSPASSNGAVGFKPTTGRLSRNGVVPISSTLDTTGPITRSVADAISLFNAMQGYDVNDRMMNPAHNGPLAFSLTPLAGIRLGYFASWQEEVIFQEAIEKLEQAGAVLVAIPDPEINFDGFDTLLGAEMYRDLAGYLQGQGIAELKFSGVDDIVAFNNRDMENYAPYGQELFDMMLELNLVEAEIATLKDSLQGNAFQALAGMFETHNLYGLLSMNNSNAGLAALSNYPALTIPLGLDVNSRPQGLTIIMPSWQDQGLVSLGLSIETLVGNRQMPEIYQ